MDGRIPNQPKRRAEGWIQWLGLRWILPLENLAAGKNLSPPQICHVLVTEGKDRVLPVFRELANGKTRTRVLDVLFCEGCINGPKMTNALSGFARREMLTDHINERNRLLAGQDVQDSLG